MDLSLHKAIADIVGVDRNAVSKWLEPYLNVVKDLRIDRSKEGYEVKKKSKLYLIDDERVRNDRDRSVRACSSEGRRKSCGV